MKYGFIGCGNMGGAIARALSKKTNNFAITDRSGRGKNLAEELGCTYTTAQEIIMNCKYVFLAVKPQMMASVLSPLTPLLAKHRPILITMAAGIEMAKISEYAGTPLPIIRIMPNTPVAVGSGLTAYSVNELITEDDLEVFVSDLSGSGKLDRIDEHIMDAVTALSGSSPAFMYVFLEALADGAVACGIPRNKALEYAALTMRGAAEMVLQSGEHPAVLKDAVCSPAGSTIVGINVLEQKGFRGAVMDCVQAAYKKNVSIKG